MRQVPCAGWGASTNCVSRRSAIGAAAGLLLTACQPPRDADSRAVPVPRPLAASTPVESNQLKVLLIELPGLVAADGSGPMADLVKVVVGDMHPLEATYDVQPLARVVDAVTRGDCDLAMPDLRLSKDARQPLPYRQSTATLGRVSFVLYSNEAERVDRARVLANLQQQPFKLSIEGPVDMFAFPTLPLSSLESALRKVAAGRIDALLWAQEEADLELRRLALPNIRREHFDDFDEVLMLPLGPRGERLDVALSAAVSRLQQSGALQQAYLKMHLPFQAWQMRPDVTPHKRNQQDRG